MVRTVIIYLRLQFASSLTLRYVLNRMGCTVAAPLVDFGHIDERVVFGGYSRLIRFFASLSELAQCLKFGRQHSAPSLHLKSRYYFHFKHILPQLLKAGAPQVIIPLLF